MPLRWRTLPRHLPRPSPRVTNVSRYIDVSHVGLIRQNRSAFVIRVLKTSQALSVTMTTTTTIDWWQWHHNATAIFVSSNQRGASLHEWLLMSSKIYEACFLLRCSRSILYKEVSSATNGALTWSIRCDVVRWEPLRSQKLYSSRILHSNCCMESVRKDFDRVPFTVYGYIRYHDIRYHDIYHISYHTTHNTTC